MSVEVIDLATVAAEVSVGDPPKAVAEVDDYVLAVVKVVDDLGRHRHDNADELFYVIDGAITVELPLGEVHLRGGQICGAPWHGAASTPGRSRDAAVARTTRRRTGRAALTSPVGDRHAPDQPSSRRADPRPLRQEGTVHRSVFSSRVAGGDPPAELRGTRSGRTPIIQEMADS